MEPADALRAIVGAEQVLTDRDVVATFVTDWTGRFHGSTPAVVRPGDADEVAATVAWCAENGIAIVPQGGNTGLVGGSVPLGGEIVLSTSRLVDLSDVDVDAAQVTVGAGVTLERLQAAARPHGLELAVDLAARGTATVGGMVATNAGGTRVLRHGPMRSQVVGIEAVLGDGSVVSHLQGLLKDNTGYDLAGLLCGSEGTLGVITAVRVRLVPIAAARATLLLALPDAQAAVECIAVLRGSPVIEGAELFFSAGVRLVCDHLSIAPPFPSEHPAYLLVEAASDTDPTDAVLERLAGAGDRITDTAVATSSGRRADLWRYREGHTEAMNARGVPRKLDVTIPLGRLASFCDDVAGVISDVAPAAETFLFGHAGDGNVHVNVVDLEERDVDALDAAVLGLVVACGGSISAEHGIGTAKRPYLHLNRTPAEIDAFRRIKAALDPAGVLNPNVLLPPADQEG